MTPDEMRKKLDILGPRSGTEWAHVAELAERLDARDRHAATEAHDICEHLHAGVQILDAILAELKAQRDYGDNRIDWSELKRPEPTGFTTQPEQSENEKRLAKEAWDGFVQAARERERAEKAEASLAMHPDGRCGCAGEGTCQWCRLMAAEARLAEVERDRDKVEVELKVMSAGEQAAHDRALKAEARVRELEAWQLAIAEPLGYVNRADGRDGFEVADAATVLAELRADRAVCICGCPDADHESYDEDGESCGIDDHECVRVCTAAAEIVARLRRAQAAIAGTTQADLAFARIRELEHRVSLQSRVDRIREFESDLAKAERRVAALEATPLYKAYCDVLIERDRARDFARRWRELCHSGHNGGGSLAWHAKRDRLAAEEDAK